MLIVLLIVSFALLGFIVYLAISKKSSRGIKWAALAALAVIFIAVGICLFLVFFEPVAEFVPIISDLPGKPVEQAESTAGGLIIFLIVMIVFFAAIFYISFREQRRRKKEKQKA